MSKTGRYVYNKELKQVVKISDDIPRLRSSVWYPKGGYAYFDKAMQRKFYSKTEKRDYMKANGLTEAHSKPRSDKELCEIVNCERNKQSLKSKTVSELKGD